MLQAKNLVMISIISINSFTTVAFNSGCFRSSSDKKANSQDRKSRQVSSKSKMETGVTPPIRQKKNDFPTKEDDPSIKEYSPLPAVPNQPPLRFRWSKNTEFTYQYRFVMDDGNSKNTVTGVTHFRKVGNSDPSSIEFGEDRSRQATQFTESNRTRENYVSRKSCFFIHPDGLAITCLHHVEYGTPFILVDGEEVPAVIVETDPVNDLALLRVNRKRNPYLSLGNANELEMADEIASCMKRFDDETKIFQPNYVTGSISGFIKHSKVSFSALTLDANMDSRFNGSPIVDNFGNAVGIYSTSFGYSIHHGNIALRSSAITGLAKKAGITLPTINRAGFKLPSSEKSKKILDAVCPLVIRGPEGTDYNFEYEIEIDRDVEKKEKKTGKGIVGFSDTGVMNRAEPYVVPYYLISPVEVGAELSSPHERYQALI